MRISGIMKECIDPVVNCSPGIFLSEKFKYQRLLKLNGNLIPTRMEIIEITMAYIEDKSK